MMIYGWSRPAGSVQTQADHLAGGVHQHIQAAIQVGIEGPSLVRLAGGDVGPSKAAAFLPRHFPRIGKNASQGAGFVGEIQFQLLVPSGSTKHTVILVTGAEKDGHVVPEQGRRAPDGPGLKQNMCPAFCLGVS
jgi:hypothetical protein